MASSSQGGQRGEAVPLAAQVDLPGLKLSEQGRNGPALVFRLPARCAVRASLAAAPAGKDAPARWQGRECLIARSATGAPRS